MAWNEPGNKNDDPWKNKGKDQGPPDLDDLFKDLGKKFGGIFGGGKSSGSQGGGSGAAKVGLGLIAAILIAIWGVSGFYTLNEAERGVVLRFGKFDHIAEPGLRWKFTFVDRVLPVNVEAIGTLRATGMMLTEDENVVNVEMELQYRVVDPRAFLFNATNPIDSLSQAFDSALRYVVGHSRMDDVLTSGRENVRQATWSELTNILTPYQLGVNIVDVNFKDARPPEQVKDAFDDAIAAQEDEERFIREAEAYAREIEPRARGRVKRMEQEAQAYKERVTLEARGEVARFNELLPQYQAAPEVTRDRLYIAALQEVYSNSTKILVDSDGSGNMIYLPLDKILEKQQAQPNRPVQRNDVDSVREEAANSSKGSSPANSRGLRNERPTRTERG